MFCSKCGKTLALEAQQCPFCGMPVGESRFEGSPYTSAQAHILPTRSANTPVTQAYSSIAFTGAGETPAEGGAETETAYHPAFDGAAAAQSYTRTTYTSKGEDAAEEGDIDTRTTYRPVFEGTSAPEDVRKDMQDMIYGVEEPDGDEPVHADLPVEELSEEARQTLDAMDAQLKMEALDLSRFRARPIKSTGQTGISSDVSDFIQKMESDQPRKAASRRRRDVYEEYQDVATADAPIEGEEQPEVFNDIDEEEFEEIRHSSFGIKDVLKVAVALVLVAALFVGGVMWFRYIRGNQSSAPIENVSEELYDAGIALIKSHAEPAYADEMMQAYSAEGGGLTALAVKLQTSSAALNALTPAEATENELLFIDALKKIESNIANCITSDALAVSQNDAEAIAQSDERWTVVSNSIAMLEGSKSASELTAIINGEEVEVLEAEATPSPTPAVNYNTLSKGAKSDEVLDMQTRLYQLGFFLDDRDGAFGTKTQTAVKMFQQAAGLPISGIADGPTLAALYADDAPRTEYAQPTPTPTPAPTPAPTAEPAAEEAPANE